MSDTTSGRSRNPMSSAYRTMQSIEARIWWGPVIRGLIALVLGVVVFSLNASADNAAVRLACIWIGVFAIANGVIALLGVVLDHSGAPHSLAIVVAVISIVIGLLLVIWPVTMAAIAIIALGVFLLAVGAIQLYSGIKLRQADPTHRVNGLIVVGAVLLVLGVVTVFLPIFVAKVFIFVAALLLVLIGVALIATGFSIRRELGA